MKKAKIWPFWPWKRTFKAIQSNLSFDSSLVPFLAALCQNREKVTEQFWANDLQMQKSQIWPFRPWKLTFRAIQPIYLSICDLCHPKEASCKKRGKVTEAVSEIDPSPLNLDGRTDGQTDRRTDRRTDRQTDDGQISIRKAPLPFGWRS